MKNKSIVAIILATVCLPFNLQSQQTKLLTAEKHNEYGIVYSLPKTTFRVEVVAVKETRIAGPMSNYAKIFTANSEVISNNSENWTIESVKVTPYGVADTDNLYLMQLKAGATTYIGVAEDGMLLSINAEPTLAEEENISVVLIEGEKTNGKEFLEFVNEDFITAQSSYKKAQLIAEELMEVRDARLSLTRGTADAMPTDGRQLEIMLAALEKQENSLMQAFTGNSWKERVVETFTFTPEEEGKFLICRLSSTKGFANINDNTAEPLYVNVKVIEEPELPVDAKGEEKKLPKDAIIYCVPGSAELSFSFGGKTLSREIYPMSQFGFNYGLSPSLFTDKKEPSFAIFDPTTGALKELGSIKQQ